MARLGDLRWVIRVEAAGLLLMACIAPWGAALAGTSSSASRGPVVTSTGTWSALIASQGSGGTVGSPVSIASSMWVKQVTYPSPIGKVDAGYAVDVVNTGTQLLSAQDYPITVTQFDTERFVSLWLCFGGTWTGLTCSGTIEQVGSVQDVTANGTWVFHSAASANPGHFALGVGGRLSLLVTNDSKGHTVPQNLEALGVSVSRMLSVRVATSVNA